MNYCLIYIGLTLSLYYNRFPSIQAYWDCGVISLLHLNLRRRVVVSRWDGTLPILG